MCFSVVMIMLGRKVAEQLPTPMTAVGICVAVPELFALTTRNSGMIP